MKRLALAATTTAAAIAAAALTSAAPASSRSVPRELRITSSELLLTGPKTAPAPGDHYEYYDRDTGGDSGHDYFECVVTDPTGSALCTADFVLAQGQITIQGVFNFDSNTVRTDAVITGGTGRYTTAAGTVSAGGTAAKTTFSFHLAP
jgi:hypothetical protein